MSEVDPDGYKEGEEGDNDGGGEVVEGFGGLWELFEENVRAVSFLSLKLKTYGEEKIADIMRDVDR